jgi:hypothetical protein
MASTFLSFRIFVSPFHFERVHRIIRSLFRHPFIVSPIKLKLSGPGFVLYLGIAVASILKRPLAL